jgi:hypothetical protein
MRRAVEKELSASGELMKTAPDSVHGVRTDLMSELENPDSFERFAGYQPCCLGHLE